MTLRNKILELLQDLKNREIVNEKIPTYILSRTIGEQEDVDHYKNRFETYGEETKFILLRWYIKLLPEFQAGNPGYKVFTAPFDGDYNETSLKLHSFYTPKTISEALLKSGAMTVQELEAEWGKLSK